MLSILSASKLIAEFSRIALNLSESKISLEYGIFNNLKNIPQMKNNVFLWFRLGLSALNIYLISIRNIKQKQKKFYQKQEMIYSLLTLMKI